MSFIVPLKLIHNFPSFNYILSYHPNFDFLLVIYFLTSFALAVSYIWSSSLISICLLISSSVGNFSNTSFGNTFLTS